MAFLSLVELKLQKNVMVIFSNDIGHQDLFKCFCKNINIDLRFHCHVIMANPISSLTKKSYAKVRFQLIENVISIEN